MAQKTILECDRLVRNQPCGAPVEERTTFVGRDSITYSLDLCEKHVLDFDKALQPFIEIADPIKAKTGSAVRKALKGKGGGKPFTTKDVRNWLIEQGRDVPASGRLPNALIEEYQAAQKV